MEPNHSEEPTVPIDVPAALEPAVREMIARRARGVPVESLSYASASTEPRRPVTSIPLTIALACLSALYTYLLVFYIPRFKDIFADFRIELPDSTKVVLTITYWFDKSYGWLWIWAVPIVLPIVITQLMPPRKTRSGTRLAALVLVTLVVAVLSFEIMHELMNAPMFQLIDSLSGPPHR